jgi:hypothetical protein
MNLELFIVFSVLSLIFICLAYAVREDYNIMALALLGFITLFLLGGLLQFGGVTQKTGSTVTVVGAVSSISYDYAVISDSTSVWIGRWLSIVSAIAFAITLANNKESDPDE